MSPDGLVVTCRDPEDSVDARNVALDPADPASSDPLSPTREPAMAHEALRRRPRLPEPESQDRVRPERVIGISAALIVHGLFAFWLLLVRPAQIPVAEPAPALETVFIDMRSLPIVAPPPPVPTPPEDAPPPRQVDTVAKPPLPAPPVVTADATPVSIASTPPIQSASMAEDAPVQAPPATTGPTTLNLTSALTGPLNEWQMMLLRHLHQHLRYPVQARRRHQQGVTLVRFVIDRHGDLRSAQLESSSGHELLDEEALAVLARAQPLPAPPASVAGTTIEIVVPVSYRLRRS